MDFGPNKLATDFGNLDWILDFKTNKLATDLRFEVGI
jgi:hypothetical protein